jgi:DNA-binding transcriptional LysR family regulator
MDWGTWLTALGIGELKSAGALHFTQCEQVIQAAAISGQGVALGRQLLVDDLIESGALVAPFKQTLVGSMSRWAALALFGGPGMSSRFRSASKAQYLKRWARPEVAAV